MDNYEVEGGSCPHCGEPARLRECYFCGKREWLIDCGHYAQPRPIAGNGTASPNNDVCDDCEAAWEDMEHRSVCTQYDPIETTTDRVVALFREAQKAEDTDQAWLCVKAVEMKDQGAMAECLRALIS